METTAVIKPKAKPVITVRQFMPDDHPAVAKLFHVVMQTFHTDPASELHAPWREYVDKRLRTDMADIPGTYIAAGGNFWVAVASDPSGSDSERIAGIIGLERKVETTGEVRSVFVSVDHHRLGIGRALMTRLLDWARDHGFSRLYLETISDNFPSRGFYEFMGFEYQPHSPPLMMLEGRLELAEYAIKF